jgi:phosphoglycerol transferase MdoB-like AlkP superfamily enzyme
MNRTFLYSHFIKAFISSVTLHFTMVWISLPEGNTIPIESIFHRSFWTGTVLLFLIFNLFYLFKPLYYLILSVFLTFLFLGLSFVHSIKMEKRSDPLVPQDIYVLKESWNMAKTYIETEDIVIAGIAMLIFFSIIIYIIKQKQTIAAKFKSRVIVSVISLIIILTLANMNGDQVWKMLGITNKMTQPDQNLIKNGFVMGNFLQVVRMTQQKPEGYSTKVAEDLIGEINDTGTSIDTKGKDKKPTIVMLQLEAFFDPTTLPHVTFSEDPMPFFRSLQDQYTSGRLGVNVFGAGTANTEFEVLTSMSLHLITYGTHPFTSHVDHPIDSIAHQLKRYGYKTSGMHNNVGWFYKREEVYPRLGIDHLVFKGDMDYKETVYDVPAVPKDYELFEEIMNRTTTTKEKDFVLGITMELHGPYHKWREHKITVESDVLSEEHVAIVEEYAYKLNEVDKALKDLVRYYEDQTEPTMIVMYGDHLPWLGDERIIYEKLGYDDKTKSIENNERMYFTPFVIWDNYRAKEKKEMILGSTFLVPYVLGELGVNGNALQGFLQEKLREGIYRFGPPDFQEQEGWNSETIKEYQYLQQYYLNNPPNYHLKK